MGECVDDWRPLGESVGGRLLPVNIVRELIAQSHQGSAGALSYPRHLVMILEETAEMHSSKSCWRFPLTRSAETQSHPDCRIRADGPQRLNQPTLKIQLYDLPIDRGHKSTAGNMAASCEAQSTYSTEYCQSTHGVRRSLLIGTTHHGRANIGDFT